MFKINQKYKDFLGNEKEKTLRFNLSESQLFELAKTDSRFTAEYLAFLLEDRRYMEMVDIIRELLVLSYGELSDDGERFDKDADIQWKFVHSAAYDQLFNDMISGENEKLIEEFMYGIVPEKFATYMKEHSKTQDRITALPVKS